MLFNVCLAVETQVTILYWSYLSWSWSIPKFIDTCPNRLKCHFYNILVHGYPSIVTWTLLLTEPTLIKKSHYWWMIGYLGFFFSIHIPYTLVNKPLYPHVDFRTIWGYVALVVCVILNSFTFWLCLKVSEKVRTKKPYNII